MLHSTRTGFIKKKVILIFPFSNTYSTCFINDFSVLSSRLKQNTHCESAMRMIKKFMKLSLEQKYYKNLGFLLQKFDGFFPCNLHNLCWLFSSVLMESGELSNFWSLGYEQFIPVKTALHWMPACIQTVRLLLEWNTDTAPSVPFTLRQLLSLQSSFNSKNFRTLSALTTGPQTSLIKWQNEQTKGRGKSTKTMS